MCLFVCANVLIPIFISTISFKRFGERNGAKCTNFRKSAGKIFQVDVSEVHLTPPNQTYPGSQMEDDVAGRGLEPVFSMDCTQEPPEF